MYRYIKYRKENTQMENVIDTNFEEMFDYFGDELTEDYDHFENFRKNITTTIAYLIGVPDDKFTEGEWFDEAEYIKLKNNDNAAVVRALCKLRTQFLRNYKSIDDARKYEMRPLETLTDYLDIDDIKFLRNRGIEVNIANAKSPTVNIAHLNQYILDEIEKIKPLIPDWVKFQYIKAMFLMSGGYAGHNGSNLKNNYKKIFAAILDAGKVYSGQRNSYPFQMYIAWPYPFRESDGNILYNDLKFLKLLYAANGDRFQAYRYVVDATSDTKEGVYEFLSDAVNTAFFVDCENVDPYAFGATILNLDEGALSKIKRIVLYDDVNTSTAWDYIADIIDLPIVKKDIERVLEGKSLVDITMTAGVCEEYYRNDMESIILASSDSDFWALIQQLPNARFLVLNEYRKTSGAIIEKMDQCGIQHCYMSDFAQDQKIQNFKSDVLYLGLAERIKRFNSTGEFGTLDVAELVQQLFYEANIGGAEGQVQKEKDAFFNKYLKNGLLIKPVVEDGKMVFRIEVYKK